MSDVKRETVEAIRNWQDHMQGQLECLTRVLFAALAGADEAVAQRIAAELVAYRAAMDGNDDTTQAHREGFTTVQKQIVRALLPPDQLAH